MRQKRWSLQLVVLALFLVACGSGSSSTGTETSATANAGTADEVLPDTAEPGLLRSAETAMEAIVHIEAWGAAVPVGSTSAQLFAWQGSGFVIDPTGVVVTAGHLVNAAASVEVFLPHEQVPTTARVVAVSECSDLAVLVLDGGPRPYLQWFDGLIEPGLAVSVAGYPNGDPDYELNEGEVVAVWPFGDFSWASVESSVQHTAPTSPGVSGAPLITPDASVVGVTIAYESGAAEMNFAIAGHVAESVIDRAMTGATGETIGVNARVWDAEDPALRGVWIEAVEPGSPAESVGLLAGDIVTSLQGTDLQADRTLATYCDALRDAEVDAPIAVEVMRPATGEILRGELHGDRLASISAFEVGPIAPASSAQLLAVSGGYQLTDVEYAPVSDDLGALRVELPKTWSVTSAAPIVDGEGALMTAHLAAAAASEDLVVSDAVPGVQITATDLAGRAIESFIAQNVQLRDLGLSCASRDPKPYDDGDYIGGLTVWSDCADATTWVTIAGHDRDRDIAVVVTLSVTEPSDLETLQRAVETLQITDAMLSTSGG